MTREPWDEPIDAWDPADTDFFGTPRSKDGGERGRSRASDSGNGRHRNSEVRRRRESSNVGSSAVAGVAGAVAARSAVQNAEAGFRNAETAETSETKLVPAPAGPRPMRAGTLAGLRRMLRRRWFAPSLTGGAVLCSVAFVTGVAQFAGTAACAAVPPAGVTTSGQATFFDGGVGNCSYPSLPDDDLYVALGPDEYADAGACGGFLDVTGPSGSVRVKIVDQCPECEAGHIDLSREAFSRIADPEAGLVPVTYSAAANPVVPKLSVRVKEGSSAFWLAILIDNHGNPLTKVEVDGVALSRTSFNYWVADGGLGEGPFTVRVTDNAGRTATIPGVTLDPGTVQQSAVAIGSGTAVTAPTASPSASSASASRSAEADVPLAAGAPSSSAPTSSDSSTEQSENEEDTAVSPAADTPEQLAAVPAPSSSVATPRATESTAESTGRNTCG